MKIKLEFFGQLTDITGVKDLELYDMPDSGKVLETLYTKFPRLETAKFIIAVNNDVVDSNITFTGDTTIALMPPYSGG